MTVTQIRLKYFALKNVATNFISYHQSDLHKNARKMVLLIFFLKFKAGKILYDAT
jgi:hypothetical protein